MSYFKYEKKNPTYVLEVFHGLCVESLVRSRDVYLHTHLGLSRYTLRVIKIMIHVKNLVIASVAA